MLLGNGPEMLKHSSSIYQGLTKKIRSHHNWWYQSRRSHFLPIPLTSTTFWRVLMAFSRTGSTDCMIPSLLSISLIWGCMPSMAFIFLATSTRGCPSSSLLRILAVRAFWMFLMAVVLATAASESPLASEERAEERVDSRLTRRSSSFMESYLLAATAAMMAANFIVILIIPH